MASKSTINVRLLGDNKSLVGALGDSESRIGAWAGRVGKIGLAAGAAIAGGLAGAAVGLAKIGESFDGAYDTIRIGTGATGEALDALEQNFRNVVSSVPADFGDASTAIADLNTRLGLTGQPLEQLSSQILELSRITESDLGANIESVSRVFGDWGVETDNQAEKLDALFRASQATGPSVDRLSQLMVKFGSPLRQLGFDFDTTAALLGQFEQQGVNTELVMGSMRQALGRMAREGEPAEETLARVTQQIADAGSASEANAIALELFGARAGPDMAAAIREGRFEVGNLVDVVANGNETILAAAEDTNDWREQLTLLKNRAMVALEPLANRVFAGIGKGIEIATPHLMRFAEWFNRTLPIAIQWVQTNVVPVAQRAFGAISDVARTVIDWFVANWPTIRDVAAQVVDGIMQAWDNVGRPTMDAIVSAGGAVVGWVRENWPEIQATIERVVAWLRDEAWPVIQQVAQFVIAEFEALVGWVRENWPQIRETIEGVIEAVRVIIETVTAVIQQVWQKWGDEILAYLSTTWETIKSVVQAAIDIVRGIINTVTALIRGDWDAAWEGIKTALSGVWDGIKAIVSGAIATVKLMLDGAWSSIKGTVEWMWGQITGGIESAWEGIKSAVSGGIDAVVGFVADLPGKVAGAIGDGFKAIWENFQTWINKIPKALNALKFEFSLPSIDTHIPGIGKIGGQSMTIDPIPFHVPEFHTGGFVRGTRGQEVPAILEAGEFVVRRSVVESGGTVDFGDGAGIDYDRLGRAVARALEGARITATMNPAEIEGRLNRRDRDMRAALIGGVR